MNYKSRAEDSKGFFPTIPCSRPPAAPPARALPRSIFDLAGRECSNIRMLGRPLRTTRIDVGLALSFGGVAYLVWVLVVGTARHVVNEIARSIHVEKVPIAELPAAARWLWNSFLHAGAVFDLVGVVWLALSLALIIGASRQRWSISWAWTCAICQAMAATMVGVWTSLAGAFPLGSRTVADAAAAPYPTAGWTSLSVAVALSLVLWVSVLVWLLYERARLRRGPSLRDGLRTHVPG